MRLEHEVTAGPRRYRYGSAPSGAISVAAFGLVAAGHDGEKSELRLLSRRSRERLAAYFNALDEVLGDDWLTRPHCCTVAECTRAGLPVRLAAPCLRFNCCNNLLGHLDRFGLPVLYHRHVYGRTVCILQLGAELTLAAVGAALGICRERARQLEAVGRRRAELTSRRRGLVVSWRRQTGGAACGERRS